MTLESSKTYIAFLRSEDEAPGVEDQLRQAPGFSSHLVTHSGNALIAFGSTATAGERASITACLT